MSTAREIIKLLNESKRISPDEVDLDSIERIQMTKDVMFVTMDGKKPIEISYTGYAVDGRGTIVVQGMDSDGQEYEVDIEDVEYFEVG